MMKKPDTILDEIHATRRRIDKEVKGMTASEQTAFFNQAGEAAAKKYGFHRVLSAKDNNSQTVHAK